jgi:hypothetical protein
MHDEKTEDGLEKTAWASVLRLNRQPLRNQVEINSYEKWGCLVLFWS